MNKTAVCAECGSEYFSSSSVMMEVCPECTSILYGYDNCDHTFKDGRCTKCYWDGSRSEYTQKLLSQIQEENNT